MNCFVIVKGKVGCVMVLLFGVWCWVVFVIVVLWLMLIVIVLILGIVLCVFVINWGEGVLFVDVLMLLNFIELFE